MFQKIKDYYQKLVPGLQEEEWKAMEQKLCLQQLKKGEFLTRQGDVCRQVSFINKGLVRMYYVVNGWEICTGFVGRTITFRSTTVFFCNSLLLEIQRRWKIVNW